jgi:hypothetical protein
MDVWGECVIARREIENGKIFAFGDGGFLKNSNLEHIDSYREGNAIFIIDLLRSELGVN